MLMSRTNSRTSILRAEILYLVHEGPLSRLAVIEEDDLLDVGAPEVVEGRS